MLYIVSGFMRSGTSMMMNALAEGGIEPAINKNRDHMNIRHGDKFYRPNKLGFFELGKREYMAGNFAERFDGMVIKILVSDSLLSLNVAQYRLIIMLRHPEEIRQSFNAFFESPISRTPPFLFDYDENMERMIGHMRNRKDMLSVDVFEYRKVLADPKKHFHILANNGWPIDVEKAAAVVDPAFCRFKLEELEIGI